MKTQNMLRMFIRDEKGNPRGFAVAVRDEFGINYGYSLLNTKMDRFNKELGIKIAVSRATNKKGYLLPETPEREELVMNAFLSLEKRAKKYFKDLDDERISIQGLLS